MSRVTAVRSALVALAALAFAAGGCARDARAPEGDSTRPFEIRVAEAIRAIFPEDPGLFRLGHRPDTGFVLYGEDPGDPLVEVECRDAVLLSLVQDGRPRGNIEVGRCPEHAARLRELTPLAPAGFETALAALRPTLDEGRVHELAAIAQAYGPGRTALPDGGTLAYFPVILEVHGVWIAPTVVLLEDRQAIVVQAMIDDLCRFRPDEGSRRLRLCSDTRNGLTELARRLR